MSAKQPRQRDRNDPSRVDRKPQRRSILVVDDEAGTVDVLIAVLSDAGFDVRGAPNGREALSKLASATPDLILLDLMMPVLDGAETLHAIQTDPKLTALRVVMMSGIPESMVKRRSRGRHYHAFLRKPFSLDDLLATVARALK